MGDTGLAAILDRCTAVCVWRWDEGWGGAAGSRVAVVHILYSMLGHEVVHEGAFHVQPIAEDMLRFLKFYSKVYL